MRASSFFTAEKADKSLGKTSHVGRWWYKIQLAPRGSLPPHSHCSSGREGRGAQEGAREPSGSTIIPSLCPAAGSGVALPGSFQSPIFVSRLPSEQREPLPLRPLLPLIASEPELTLMSLVPFLSSLGSLGLHRAQQVSYLGSASLLSICKPGHHFSSPLTTHRSRSWAPGSRRSEPGRASSPRHGHLEQAATDPGELD